MGSWRQVGIWHVEKTTSKFELVTQSETKRERKGGGALTPAPDRET